MIDVLPDLGVAPDWGLAEQSKFRVKVSKLGDGYQLREQDGINSVRREWKLTWSGLDKAPADYLYEWLRERKGVYAFLLNRPETDEYVKVIGGDPSYTYSAYGAYDVSVSVMEDFNP